MQEKMTVNYLGLKPRRRAPRAVHHKPYKEVRALSYLLPRVSVAYSGREVSLSAPQSPKYLSEERGLWVVEPK